MVGGLVVVLIRWALVVDVCGWCALSPIGLLVAWWLSIPVVWSIVWSSVVVVGIKCCL
jgi:hypothetical protein